MKTKVPKPINKDALTIAAELRDEALRLYGEAGRLQEAAMMADGTHHTIPKEYRASEKERRARMTPEQRKRFDETWKRWKEMRDAR
jgi:hypothetical protein